MFVNGLVVQKYVDNSYKGIDGSGFSYNTAQNWFLNYEGDFVVFKLHEVFL